MFECFVILPNMLEPVSSAVFRAIAKTYTSTSIFCTLYKVDRLRVRYSSVRLLRHALHTSVLYYIYILQVLVSVVGK